MVCTKASTTPLAVWRTGRLNKVLGSSTAKRGKTFSEPKKSLSPVSRRLMTAPEFISEPVAASVSTTPSGTAVLTLPLPVSSSHGSPS
jgi:hypothetical protein